MHTPAERRREFRRLHDSGCLVLPNPWDVGTTRYLQGLGFKALATTSAGAAWAMGYADGEVPLEAMLHHIRDVVKATDLPVNADFLNCYAHDAKGVANNVRLAIETGVAGISIEDSTGSRGGARTRGEEFRRSQRDWRRADGAGGELPRRQTGPL
jgi:2-methylisocitrate lyase-like PEP mutase family enzyme